MPFTILDNDEVFNANQAIWMQTDINALAAGIGGDGVLSGCGVTAQGSPDMTVAVASGVVRIGSAFVTVTSGNVTITTANATNPRIDLVVVSNAAAKSVTAGTAAANPKAPDIPANSVLLAMVYVPANDTTIETNQITDKRVLLRLLLAIDIANALIPVSVTLRASGAVTWTDMPAALTEAFGAVHGRAKADLTNAVQARIVVRVSTVGSASAEFRGQYSTDESTWNYLDDTSAPGVNISTTGTKASSWVNLAANAKADVFLRVVGINGDAVADPQIGTVILQFR